MKKRFFLPAIFQVMILFNGCDPIAIDEDLPDGSAMICVNSYFMADSSITVYVTRGRHILDDELFPSFLTSSTFFFPITDATVTVSGKAQQRMVLQPVVERNRVQEGVYRSSSGFSAGEICTVEVSSPQFNSVTATCEIPMPVPILKAELISGSPDKMGMRTVDVYFHDPAETKNYYRMVMDLTQRAADGSVIKVASPEPLLTLDPLFYYDTEPFSLDTESAPLPVLFADDAVNGKLIKVRCKVRADLSNTFHAPPVLQVELQTLSREYYLKYTTQALQRDTRSNPFAQPVTVYSNVKNGFGIFAGVSRSQFNIDY